MGRNFEQDLNNKNDDTVKSLSAHSITKSGVTAKLCIQT